MQMFIRDEGKYEVYLCDRCRTSWLVANGYAKQHGKQIRAIPNKEN
jgi:hypothetical protein